MKIMKKKGYRVTFENSEIICKESDIEKIEIYVTSDGKAFENDGHAVIHEKNIFIINEIGKMKISNTNNTCKDISNFIYNNRCKLYEILKKIIDYKSKDIVDKTDN